jgi:hypothetical protein
MLLIGASRFLHSITPMRLRPSLSIKSIVASISESFGVRVYFPSLKEDSLGSSMVLIYAGQSLLAM